MNRFNKLTTSKLMLFLMLDISYAGTLAGCPTCIGRLELQSPAFFSDELYQLNPEDDVEIWQSESMEHSASEDDEDD